MAVCLSALMFGLEISSVPVILPTLENRLHGNFKDAQWIMNAYTIACTTVLMAAGTLADRYGRKRIFIYSIVFFGLTSLICGLAQSTWLLILSRFLQGMSGGVMLICQVAILSHQFPEGHARSKAFAAWGIIFGIGLGFGPIIGGMIVAVSGWEWVFLIHVIIAFFTVLLVVRNVQESADPNAGKLDLPGIITLSLAVLGLVWYITQGPDLGFTSAVATIIIIGVVVCLALFIWLEKRSQNPMFDFSVFRIRNFSGALLGSMGMNFSFWPFMIYLPIYFQSCLGYDTVTAGLSLLIYTLPTLIFPPLGERLMLRYRAGIVIPLGMFVIGLGFIGMWIGSGVTKADWLTMMPGCLLAGMGLGIINTPVTNTTTAAVSSNRAGMASGIDMSARLISLAINIAVMGFILLAGILAYLRLTIPEALADAQMQLAAEKIATGDFVYLQQHFPSLFLKSEQLPRAALSYGFGWIMLYGGIGIWVLALLSFLTFHSRRADVSETASSVRA